MWMCVYPYVCINIHYILFMIYNTFCLIYVIFKMFKEVLPFLRVMHFISFFFFLILLTTCSLILCSIDFDGELKTTELGEVIRLLSLQIFRNITVSARHFLCWIVDNLNYCRLFFPKYLESLYEIKFFFEIEKTCQISKGFRLHFLHYRHGERTKEHVVEYERSVCFSH